jgi:hypothetical protein
MEKNQLHPPPVEIYLTTGKSMWLVNEIRVWADTYENALRMYNEIIDWSKPNYNETNY